MNKINPFPVTSTVEDIIINSKTLQKNHLLANSKDPNLIVTDNNIKKSPKDKLTCNICGKSFTRSNKVKHNKTKHHIFCTKLNEKWRDTIIK